MTIYLYIKQHRITGLRYFGKTTRDPNRYIGSGLHWRRHLKQHGKDIETRWTMGFEDPAECRDFAEAFSELFDIVACDTWANMKPENGLDGWPAGVPNPRSVPVSEESRIKRSNALRGRSTGKFGPLNHNFGKPLSAEVRAKISASRQANPTAVSWTPERRAKIAATWAKKNKEKQNVGC